MKAIIKSLALTILLALAPVLANAQVVEKKTLNLDGARKVIAAAVAYARQNNAPGGVIAVVDDGGNLMALERLDGTFSAGANISIGKAKTAVMFKRPTKFFEDIIRNGRTAMVALPDFTPLQGGVPIIVDGQLVGGVGVSGAASAQQDEELAIAGASVFTSKTDMAHAAALPVTLFDKTVVDASFAQGGVLIGADAGRNYMIHTSRREKPGLVEVHTLDTDIIYVLQGAFTLVTGGKSVGEKEIAPNEFRGQTIEGGETRQLKPGDIIVIPPGTPHWFKEVNGPVLYYTIKVR